MNTEVISSANTCIAKEQASQQLCLHCNSVVPSKQNDFCCNACMRIYRMLHDHGLEHFYRMQEIDASEIPTPKFTDRDYEFFNDPTFWDSSVQRENIQSAEDERASVTLLLEGVHCAACVWLLSKLPELIQGVLSAKLELSHSRVHIVFKPCVVQLSEIARKIESLGYIPKPYSPDLAEAQYKKEKNRLLLQLGLAGFCAGNTMLIAVSLYQGYFTGIATEYKRFLHWVSCFVSIPALLFSAPHFFSSAFAALKHRKPHIDIPISIGITLAFATSFYNTIHNADEVYYDSVCMLIFLLLLGRFLQKTSLHNASRSETLYKSLLPDAVYLFVNGERIERYRESIEIGDVIAVGEGQVIPTDGDLISELASIDNSFLTGEEIPISYHSGQRIYAGAVNVGSECRFKAATVPSQSRIAKMFSLASKQTGDESVYGEFVHRYSAYFVYLILSLGALCFAYWYLRTDVEDALRACISLLIISCPCALGLATPLVFAKASREAFKGNIFVSNTRIFEKLPSVQNFFFDKTGTLTEGKFTIQQTFLFSDMKECNIRQYVTLLEEQSAHPLRSAFLRDKDFNESKIYLEKSEELQGKGLFGQFSNGCEVLVGSLCFLEEKGCLIEKEVLDSVGQCHASAFTVVAVAVDKKVVCLYGLADALREGAQAACHYLAKKGVNVTILSGDNKFAVASKAQQLQIAESEHYYDLSPEEKKNVIANCSLRSCMLGDGINDILALSAADCSIAVSGGCESAFIAADSFIKDFSFDSFVSFYVNCKRSMKAVKTNVVISLLYNAVAIVAAFAGLINPLVAAIFMPLSSLTVILNAMRFSFKDYNVTRA